jgi:hypothetical protein
MSLYNNSFIALDARIDKLELAVGTGASGTTPLTTADIVTNLNSISTSKVLAASVGAKIIDGTGDAETEANVKAYWDAIVI